MGVWIVRLAFVIFLTGMGGTFYHYIQDKDITSIEGLIGGFALGILAVAIEYCLKWIPSKNIVLGTLGFCAGLATSWLILYTFVTIGEMRIPYFPQTAFSLVMGYLGFAIAVKHAPQIQMSDSNIVFNRAASRDVKILDTSVIIDGRIADLCETGFISGKLMIPHFVLNELQRIADSSDSLKRKRGRRGLDVLNNLQTSAYVTVQITHKDYTNIKEVDAKLVKLGEELTASVLTTDFNLNKVAEIQGVQVLNINDLANALKPVVLPGEDLRIFLVKEGKEYNQAVGYLDDGTMVVVDNGRKHINQKVDVMVTSVLQTSAGKMIFTKMNEAN
jgi:uncharacterized protein YacL